MATSGNDWYPQSLGERVDFHINFDTQAPALAEKYGWSAAQLAGIHADRIWLEYWYHSRDEVDSKRAQLTGYISAITGNRTDLDKPETPDFTPSGAPPSEVAPGIEARTRELRREAVGRSFYSKADGLALGFERPASTGADLSNIAPDIKLRTLANYAFEATFSKQGMDAVRFEFRHKGGNWMPLGDKASSPATLTITPIAAGEAEQIEIRAVFLRKYEPVGVYSPIYSVLIAP